jgi:cytoskeleton protein RodZ
MSTPPASPPDIGHDEKAQEAVRVEGPVLPAFAEVTEALNGLKELAERVQIPNAPVVQTQELITTQEQLSLELPVAALAVPAVEAVSASPAVPRRPRVGESLREAREAAGFSLEDVAQELKIKTLYLKAIEESRFDDLPTRTHAVGFVRTYASALQLHSEELVARCRAEIGTTVTRMAPVARVSNVDRQLPGSALMTACAVAAVVIYIISYGAFSTFQPAPSYPSRAPKSDEAKIEVPAALDGKPIEVKTPAAKKSAEVEEPSLSAVPAISGKSSETQTVAFTMMEAPKTEKSMNEGELMKPAVAAPSRIKLHAAADVEVRIMDEKGRVLAERMIHKGEAFFVPDQKNYTMTTSDAGALKVQVDGREMPALGETGEAMHNIPLNSADLLEVLAE